MCCATYLEQSSPTVRLESHDSRVPLLGERSLVSIRPVPPLYNLPYEGRYNCVPPFRRDLGRWDNIKRDNKDKRLTAARGHTASIPRLQISCAETRSLSINISVP